MRTRELKTALNLALRAGAQALEANRRGFSYEEKPDDLGPVTEADLAASRLIVEGLRAAFPDDDLLSEEETPALSAASRRFWCIDPIDGTKDFIQRNGEWAIMIGLVEDEEPVLGVLYRPDAPGGGRIWFASRGGGAWLATDEEVARMIERPGEAVCGRRIFARERGKQRPLMVCSRNHPDPESEALAGRLGIEDKRIHGSVGLKLALIAEGTGDFYVNSQGKMSLWDLCAGEAVLREAGGELWVRERAGAEFRRFRYRPDRIPVREQVFAMARGWGEALRRER